MSEGTLIILGITFLCLGIATLACSFKYEGRPFIIRDLKTCPTEPAEEKGWG